MNERATSTLERFRFAEALVGMIRQSREHITNVI
jgi:hypothetical protein